MNATSPAGLVDSTSAALRPRMLNHAAFIARDAAATVEFYTRIMGMELVNGLVDDHVPSTGDAFPYFHIFFALGDGSMLAFFIAPGLPDRKVEHPAFDIFNHFAFHCESPDEVMAWKAKLEAAGVEVLGPIDHNGELLSIYFHDPNDIRLELTCITSPRFTNSSEEAYRNLENWNRVVETAQRDGRDVADALVEHIRASRTRVVKRGEP